MKLTGRTLRDGDKVKLNKEQYTCEWFDDDLVLVKDDRYEVEYIIDKQIYEVER